MFSSKRREGNSERERDREGGKGTVGERGIERYRETGMERQRENRPIREVFLTYFP